MFHLIIAIAIGAVLGFVLGKRYPSSAVVATAVADAKKAEAVIKSDASAVLKTAESDIKKL